MKETMAQDTATRTADLKAASDALEGRTPQEILDNPPDVLERVGLARLLTPGRSNGLYSMVARIRAMAEAFAAARPA